MFLGEDALRYIIIVFTGCNKEHTKFPEKFQRSWNNEIHNLVSSVGGQWTISPNPDIFSPDDPVFEQWLEDFRKRILSTFGIYQVKYFGDYRKHHEKAMQIQRDDDKNRQEVRDENAILKLEMEIHKQQIDELIKMLEKDRKNPRNIRCALL